MPIAPTRTLAVQRSPLILPNEIGGDGCVLLMPMNEDSGDPKDYSGYGNNGTRYPAGNPPTWVDGRYGKALSFDGVNDYARLAKFISTPPMSVEIWIKPLSLPADSNYHCIIGNNRWGGNNIDQGWGIVTINYANTRLQVYLGRATGYGQGYEIARESTGYSLTTWHYVVFTYDGTYLNAWLDGAQKITNQSHTNYQDYGGQRLVMGAFRNGAQFFTEAIIDSVRIYNRTSGDDEARYLGGRLGEQRSLAVVR